MNGDGGVTITLPAEGTMHVGDEVAFAVAGSGAVSLLPVGTETVAFTRNDSIATWSDQTPSGGAHAQGWNAVASDETGNRLVAVLGSSTPTGDIWTSSNAGLTWINQTSATGRNPTAHNQYWYAVASDATGMKLVAASSAYGGPTYKGDLWTSSNGGLTWVNQTSAGAAHNKYWFSVASDATGTNLVAVEQSGGGIWTSTDAGATWVHQNVPGSNNAQAWMSVASDSTGTNLFTAVNSAGGQSGDLWTSSNMGISWVDQTTAGGSNPNAHYQPWTSVASDWTGANLAAVGYNMNGIWTSTNSGATWVHNNGPQDLESLASDATGTMLVAGNNDLWLSSNGGATLTNTTEGTAASGKAWRSLASDASGSHLVAVDSGGDIWTYGNPSLPGETTLTVPGSIVGQSGSIVKLLYTGNGHFLVEYAFGSLAAN